ncbi:sulfur oxidation c-type cytochrome SoxX [Polynucleobacter paneuropaeus]|nr:sulfur oxidation c-type cytochrome SoxX [Polynucleobacter paneuropaeus]MBT8585169.1 sulfur oxidation c-type cytochrome SoxX [Polynucleobacter paneuropaeus]MBT8595291.1 sulfur oxidation c-type cytochrome SoxX [Polynucleobacter paneuropaeus]MBT8637033.1 sulfur oxidation c-type cytochrome SoxX [Polynucleobacter paneuropaeus]MBT8638969.1 sulfur oxidation c-type cytochrome SoxX [Polynucleobacter paneuropaeus]
MSPLSIKLFKRQILTASLILGLGFLSNVTVAQQKSDPQFEKMMKDSFRAQGIAGLDRIDQDATQKFCSDPLYVASLAGAKKAIEIQKLNMSEIAQPSDGKYIGDWKSGEAIAQSGRGATWSDSATTPIGGGCYNCHQIDQKEISYGNIGPSLWNYGKNRGYSQEIITYTWNRINNSKAYNACSNMPRFAHFKLLNEKQIQDLMALLLDPQSPVNQ